ncbi:MAG: A24 family peptidase [Ruthenibacterium sp.]
MPDALSFLALLSGAAFGLLAGAFAAYAYRLLPARWLCDYGQAPAACHAREARCLPKCGIAGFAALTALCTVCITAHSAKFALSMRAGAMGGAPPAPWRIVTVSLVSACLVAALLLAAWCDFRYTILPDELLALCAALALALWALGALRFVQGTAWYEPFLGAALGFFGLWGVLALAGRIYRTEAMGFGDVKLLCALGVLCGPRALGVAAALAVLIAGAVFAVLLARKKLALRDSVPFGPFLAAGALLAVCLWPLWCALGTWYLHLFFS